MPISFIPYTAVYGPLSLPGATCALWLDGVDPLGNGSVPANGATVSTWVDKSRNGRNATGGVSPTYNTSQKAIVFNGSSWLTTSYSSVPTNETIFIVYQTTSSAVGANCFMIGPSDFLLGGRLILTVNENDGFGLSFKIGSYGVANGSRLTMAQNQMYIGTTTVASTTSYVYLNGTQGPSSTLTYSGTGTTQIGTAASGYAIYIGYIYEIVIYNTNLTTPQQQSIEGYLAQKWGLTSQLPPGHPGLRQTLYNGKVYQPQISLKPAPYANYYPLSLAGCALWLDAADPAGTGIAPANGSIISTWIDKSGTGNNGTSYGNPTFVTSAFNGKPSILFNGSTQRFLGAITNTGNTVSVFAIVSMNSGGQWGRICSLAVTNNFDGGVSSLYFIPLIRSSTNQSIQSGRYQGSGNVNVGPVAITYNVPFQAASIVNGTTNILYLNGTSAGSGSSTGNFGYTAYGIGAQPSDLQPEYFQGYISEIIIYNTALTTTQRQQIEGYLAWKWGLQSSLINTNPYYLAAPLSFGRPSQVAGIPVQVKMSAIRVVQLQYSGTYTTAGNFFATFTGNGSVTVLSPVTINYFAIGGGGGGGGGPGGGGGAGGLQMGSMSLSVGTYNIVIGPGGPAHTNGSNTTFGTTLVVALGGGFGADGYPSTETGGSGGCGGGRGSGLAGAPGTGSQGYNGGSMGGIGSGGGGGVGGVGETSPTTSNTGGAGGIGVLYYGTYYGGGGGGAPNHGGGTGFAGAGGLGGGGRGGQNGAPILDPVAGTPNTGGGGGGGRSANQYSGPGAAGGSGVFIISY